MHEYVVGVSIAVGVILCTIVTIATYLLCRQWGTKLDLSNDCQYNDFLNRVQDNGQESVSLGVKRPTPRRIVHKSR